MLPLLALQVPDAASISTALGSTRDGHHGLLVTCSATAPLRGVCGLAVFLVLSVAGSYAQTTGAVHGVVTDRDGQPVPGATVSLDALAADGERQETSTDETGHFRQTNVAPGHYSVTADTDTLGGQVFRILVHPGGSVDVRFILEPGRTPAAWQRARPGNRGAAAAFEAGVGASRAGDFAEAIEQFEAALRIMPACVDCHFNIGVSYSRLDRFEAAEAAFRDALRLRADYAAAYYGLADIYSRQNRTEEAAAARGEANRIAISALAASRARAQDILQRGIAFWNSDNVADAVRQFREALETDATLVEPYYWLGLAYEATGDHDAATQALSRYLDATPSGLHADEARQRLAALDR